MVLLNELRCSFLQPTGYMWNTEKTYLLTLYLVGDSCVVSYKITTFVYIN